MKDGLQKLGFELTDVVEGSGKQASLGSRCLRHRNVRILERIKLDSGVTSYKMDSYCYEKQYLEPRATLQEEKVTCAQEIERFRNEKKSSFIQKASERIKDYRTAGKFLSDQEVLPSDLSNEDLRDALVKAGFRYRGGPKDQLKREGIWQRFSDKVLLGKKYIDYSIYYQHNMIHTSRVYCSPKKKVNAFYTARKSLYKDLMMSRKKAVEKTKYLLILMRKL